MKHFVLLVLLIIAQVSFSQNLTQLVQVRVTDAPSGKPLTGASVELEGPSSTGAPTNEQGECKVADVPPGRYRLSVSYTGYATFVDELLVIAGKENLVAVTLSPSTEVLQEVEIGVAGEARYVPGLESVTIEKTMRVPANFFDPVRMLTSYPGVVAANDQANAIVVKGNSPNGLLWRLNGVDIVNPNHLSNAGTFSDKPMANGGGVNILSAQMLDRTNFYAGAFPASYGNALSGVLDMSLRPGNSNRTEYTAQASLIGLDLAAEGPLNKNQNSSFLANYRYSTVGLLSQMGVQFGDEDITFQDFSFNLNFEQKNGGNLSVYGFYGNSRNEFEAKPLDEWEEDKDQYNIQYDGDTYAIGLSYQGAVGPGKLFYGIAFSSSMQDREALASDDEPLEVKVVQDLYDAFRSLLSTSIRYEFPVGQKSRWEAGMMVNVQTDDLDYLNSVGCTLCSFRYDQRVEGTADGILLQPYTDFSTALSSQLTVDIGLRYVHFTYSQSSALEPRAMVNYQLNPSSSISISYGLVSQQQLPQVYFAIGNENLSFTRAHHAEVSYRHTLSSGLSLSSVAFYQKLFDVPIEADPLSTFSVLNLLEGVAHENLVNDGRGENMGITLNVEKPFFEHYYWMAGGSYYSSMYQTANDKKYDTRFNGKYTFTAVFGKEWTRQSKNRTIGLNTRALYLGGLRESPVDVVNSESNRITVYDETSPYTEKLKDYFRIDLRLSFRKDKPRYTRTFAIDIQNLLNQQNEAYHYYDFVQEKVVTKLQLGIIPVLVYRIDF